MPTYSYACTDCGHRFEAVQAFSDDSLTACPVCSGNLRKVFSAVGIVFKGSGFYRTDSRAGAVPKGEAKSEKGSESKGSVESSSDKGSSTKSESPSAGAKDKASASSSGSSSSSSPASSPSSPAKGA